MPSPAELLQLYQAALSPLNTLGAGRLQLAQQDEARRYQEGRQQQAQAAAREQAIFEAGLREGVARRELTARSAAEAELERLKAELRQESDSKELTQRGQLTKEEIAARKEAEQENIRLTYGLRETSDDKKRKADREQGEDNAATLTRLKAEYDKVNTQVEAAMQLTAKEQKALAELEDPVMQANALESIYKAKQLQHRSLFDKQRQIQESMQLLRSSDLYYGPEFRQALEDQAAAPAAARPQELSLEEMADAIAAKFGKPQSAATATAAPVFESTMLPDTLRAQLRTRADEQRQQLLARQAQEAAAEIKTKQEALGILDRKFGALQQILSGGQPSGEFRGYGPSYMENTSPEIYAAALADKKTRTQAELEELMANLQAMQGHSPNASASGASLINAASAPMELQIPLLGSLLQMRAEQLRAQ